MFNRVTFERTENFLIRLAALILLLIGIYKVIRQEWPNPESSPDPPRIERQPTTPRKSAEPSPPIVLL
jgi:hypothetical protein